MKEIEDQILNLENWVEQYKSVFDEYTKDLPKRLKFYSKESHKITNSSEKRVVANLASQVAIMRQQNLAKSLTNLHGSLMIMTILQMMDVKISMVLSLTKQDGQKLDINSLQELAELKNKIVKLETTNREHATTLKRWKNVLDTTDKYLKDNR